MMPPRSARGRLNGRSIRQEHVRRLGWLLRSKPEMRLSAWVTPLVLRAMILASKGIRTLFSQRICFQIEVPPPDVERPARVVRTICSGPLYTFSDCLVTLGRTTTNQR
jgi:hypothetical protein